MDRPTVYVGALPRAEDFLSLGQDAMVGLAKLAEACLGTSAVVDGFTLVPTAPAGLSAVLSAGTVYEQENLESSAWSALPSDAHVIVKQGIALDPQNLTFTPPPAVGYSQSFLVEVSYQDADSGSLVLPYYNAANPQVPFSGPGNAGTANNTVRKGAVAVQVKAGIAAPSGTQVIPAPDAGWAGIYVVTLAQGATSVTAGNIVRYSAAPFLYAKLGQIPQSVQSDVWCFALDQGVAANAVIANPTPSFSAYQQGQRLRVKMAFAPTGPATINVSSLGAIPIVKGGGAALGGGEWAVGDYVEMACAGATWQLIGASAPQSALWHVGIDSSTNAAAITAPAVAARGVNLAYLIIPKNDCAGATSIDVGFGPQPFTRNDANALQAGDYIAKQPLLAIDDGTQLRIVSLTFGQSRRTIWGGVDTGSADAMSVAPTMPLKALTDGLILNFIKGGAPNATATPSVSVSALAAAIVTRCDGSSLVAGDLPASTLLPMQYVLASNTFRMLWPITPKQVAVKLSGNLTVYVRSDGSDSNNGLTNSPTGAFQTIQGAWNAIFGLYTSAGFTITIQLAHAAGETVSTFAGARFANYNGNVVLTGLAAEPQNFIVSTPGAASNIACQINTLFIQNLTLDYAYTGTPVFESNLSANGGSVQVGPNVRYTCSAGSRANLYENYAAGSGSQIIFAANATTTVVAGGASRKSFVTTTGGATVQASQNTAITNFASVGTVNYTGSFSLANNASNQSWQFGSFTGFTATGLQYQALLNSAISLAGTTLPGSTQGTVSSGGQAV